MWGVGGGVGNDGIISKTSPDYSSSSSNDENPAEFEPQKRPAAEAFVC